MERKEIIPNQFWEFTGDNPSNPFRPEPFTVTILEVCNGWVKYQLGHREWSLEENSFRSVYRKKVT